MKYGNKNLLKVEGNVYKVEGKTEFYFVFKIRGRKHIINATKDYGIKNKTKAIEQVGIVIRNQRDKGINNITSEPFEYYFTKHLEEYTSQHTLDAYNRHWGWIKPYIGHLKPSQIKRATIENLLNTVYKDKTDTVKEKLGYILSPVFRKLVKNGIIEYSPIDSIIFPAPKVQIEALPTRLMTPEKDMIKVAIEVFESILLVEDERGKKNKRLFYLFSIMLLRRRSEILQYTYGDIKDGYIYVKKEYTKHNEAEILLLPKEILDEIDNLNIKDPNEKLVKMHYTWASSFFKTIVKQYPKMRLHDLRSLFFIVMFEKGQNMDILDVCLSHTIKGTRKHYLTAMATRKNDVFKEWWKVLRNRELNTE